MRLTTRRSFRPKLVEFFHSSPSLYARWNVTLNIGPLSVSLRQMLALTAPWRICWTGGGLSFVGFFITVLCFLLLGERNATPLHLCSGTKAGCTPPLSILRVAKNLERR